MAVFILLALIAAGAAFHFWPRKSAQNTQNQDEMAVKNTVLDFGSALKNVSLLSPTVGDDMKKNYGNYLTQELLNIWEANPKQALGKITSSPWPENIEILGLRQLDANTYIVAGQINLLASSGPAGSQPIGFIIVKSNGKWLISNAALTYSADGVEFEYPVNLPAKYVSAQNWPPSIKIEKGVYSCKQTPPTSSSQQLTAERVLNGRHYCVSFTSRSLAGSVYMDYTYITSDGDNNLIKAIFTLKYQNCASFPELENKECSAEREQFNPDNLIDGIVQTVVK